MAAESDTDSFQREVAGSLGRSMTRSIGATVHQQRLNTADILLHDVSGKPGERFRFGQLEAGVVSPRAGVTLFVDGVGGVENLFHLHEHFSSEWVSR